MDPFPMYCIYIASYVALDTLTIHLTPAILNLSQLQ